MTTFAVGEELYQATVPVASYSSGDFNKAVAGALKQVLINVSGNSDITKIAGVQKTLEKPDQFIQSYNYTSGADRQLSLSARFSPKAVNKFLQGMNQPVLASAKAPVVVDNAPRDNALSQNSISSQNGNLPPVIESTSEGVSTFAVAPPQNFNASPEPVATPAASGAPIVDLTAPGAERAVQSAPSFAEHSEWIDLSISGVSNVDEYEDVVRYLRSLSSVASVETPQTQSDRVFLKVRVTQGRRAFMDELRIGDRLTPELHGSGDPNAPSALLYRWMASPSGAESFPVTNDPLFPDDRPENRW